MPKHSPFNIFRKRQRVLLAIIGVICILTFVVGDIFLTYFGPGTATSVASETVVTWKGGELTESEMAALRGTYQLTLTYLDEIVAEARKLGGTPKAEGLTPLNSEELMVRKILLADQAQKMGMEAPDEAIVEYLAQLTDRTLSSEDLRKLLISATDGRLSRDQLFSTLRRELLVRNYVALITSGDAMTPQDAWNYYNRMTRRISTSLLEFSAQDFLDQAPQPTPAQVREFYEKYKDQYSYASSPEPGFKQRPKFIFGYFQANYDKFMEQEKAKITPEEVQKHYEENKDRYQVPELPEVKTDAKTDGAAATPAEQTPAESPNTTPAPEQPGETPVEPPADEVPAQNADPSAEPAAESVPSEPPSECGQEETEPAATVKEAPAEAGEQPAGAGEPKKEIQYQPLEQVEDDIRRTLASQRVRERMEEVLAEAKRAVDRYRRSYESHRIQTERGAKAKKPSPPDFEEIAQQLGLGFGRTPLVDELTVGETELGQATIYLPSSLQQVTFAQLAMQNEQAALYQANTLESVSDLFLYWPEKVVESRTPELEEIRKEVVRQWRLQRAFELAMDAAREAVEKIRKAPTGKPLNEIAGVKESKVIQPPAFSWMTSGSVPFGGGSPFVSEVQGVENAGQEFMEEAFSLEVGEVGVAPNASKTAAYVIRMEGETPSEEDRRQTFLETGIQFNFNLYAIAMDERSRKISVWLEELQEAWNIDWKRPPRGGMAG